FLSSHRSVPPSPQTYTLSLHDALPISNHMGQLFYVPLNATPVSVSLCAHDCVYGSGWSCGTGTVYQALPNDPAVTGFNLPGTFRSEEHTSELQSLRHLVCRLLLEKKNR